jgi:hypothetical protein
LHHGSSELLAEENIEPVFIDELLEFTESGHCGSGATKISEKSVIGAFGKKSSFVHDRA